VKRKRTIIQSMTTQKRSSKTRHSKQYNLRL